MKVSIAFSEDEHHLIAQYCQTLNSDGTSSIPRSPIQIVQAIDAEQKEELEAMIRELEEENKSLQAEYDLLKSKQTTPNGTLLSSQGALSEAGEC